MAVPLKVLVKMKVRIMINPKDNLVLFYVFEHKINW